MGQDELLAKPPGGTPGQGGPQAGGGRGADPRAVAQAILAVAAAAAENEADRIKAVAGRIAGRVLGGGKVFAFGAGHAQAFGMELCSRAGGLRCYQSMNLEDLRADKRDAWKQLSDSAPERDPANAAPLLDHYGITSRDCVLIASNSGRNGVTIELGYLCRARGIYTVGFTSLRHSRGVESRHPSGARLLDVVDDLIDIHTPLGDAVIERPGHGRGAAASTVCFALLAQMLNMAVADELIARGQPVQFIVSANVGG